VKPQPSSRGTGVRFRTGTGPPARTGARCRPPSDGTRPARRSYESPRSSRRRGTGGQLDLAADEDLERGAERRPARGWVAGLGQLEPFRHAARDPPTKQASYDPETADTGRLSDERWAGREESVSVCVRHVAAQPSREAGEDDRVIRGWRAVTASQAPHQLVHHGETVVDVRPKLSARVRVSCGSSTG